MARKSAAEETLEQARDRGLEELQKLIAEASELLKDGESFAGEKADKARQKIGALLDRASGTFATGRHEVVAQGREAFDSAKTFVCENPWRSAAIGVGALLLGRYLLGRRNP